MDNQSRADVITRLEILHENYEFCWEFQQASCRVVSASGSSIMSCPYRFMTRVFPVRKNIYGDKYACPYLEFWFIAVSSCIFSTAILESREASSSAWDFSAASIFSSFWNQQINVFLLRSIRWVKHIPFARPPPDHYLTSNDRLLFFLPYS